MGYLYCKYPYRNSFHLIFFRSFGVRFSHHAIITTIILTETVGNCSRFSFSALDCVTLSTEIFYQGHTQNKLNVKKISNTVLWVNIFWRNTRNKFSNFKVCFAHCISRKYVHRDWKFHKNIFKSTGCWLRF